MNGYDLSRQFVNFGFDNPSKIKPNHYAVYFFAIEHCNRLGWKKEFGLPTTMVMEAVGIKSYNTYIKTFNDLVDFGFFKVVERSRNQYSSNIVELSYYNKALDKALDKALIKHVTKQSESTEQSIDSINKQTNNKQTNNINTSIKENSHQNYFKQCLEDTLWCETTMMQNKLRNLETLNKYLELFLKHCIQYKIKKENLQEFCSHFLNWLRKQDIQVVLPDRKKIKYV